VSELRGLLVGAVRTAFDELRRAHPDEVFYAFALEVADDGCGAAGAAQRPGAAGGRGRANMHTRARQLGGAFDVLADDAGTRVHLHWPLPAA